MAKITSEEIKYFLTVAECLNFTEASRRLFVSQPAITKWIKHLEQELGIELFIRNNKTVRLTPAGTFLYQEWSVLSEQFTATLNKAHKIQEPENEALHFGVMYGLDYDNFLFNHINRFRTIHPNISTHIHIYNFHELKQRAADMDFVLTSNLEEGYLPGSEQMIVSEMKVYIAIAAENPLAHKAELYMKDLKYETFFCISEDTNSKCIQNLIQQFAAINVRPVISPVDNIQTCLAAVHMNQGVSVIDQNFLISHENVLLRECIDFVPELYRLFLFNNSSNKKTACQFKEFVSSELDDKI